MKKNSFVGLVLASAMVAGAGLTTSGAAFAATSSDHAAPGYTSAELIEGVVFLQGDLGRSLIEQGALGDISAAEKTEVESLLAQQTAKDLAVASTKQLLDEHPKLATDLQSALDASDPIAVSAALRNVAQHAVNTAAVRTATAESRGAAQTYVPGEVGPDCLFNVAVGGVLVIAVAAVAVGVVALASVAAVGSVYVAGQNAARKQVITVSDADDQFVAALLQSV